MKRIFKEILRAGVEAVPRGQLEAARSLGMSQYRAMLHVIGPQAIKNALPPLTGQFLNLIKDSSLLMMIGVTELMKRSEDLQGGVHAPFEVYLPLAGFYLLLTFPLARFTGWLEKRLSAINAARISGTYSRMDRNRQGCGIVSIQHHWISKVQTEPLFNPI